jgi:phosphoglycolate phosphatase-like HAD superfamily hydrolase
MNKLVLFDIDGTLITAGGAGTRSMNLAFRELFGIEEAFRDILMAGKTDIEIIKEGLKMNGITYEDRNVGKMKDMYLQFLATEIDNPQRRLHPGIRTALEVLQNNGMPLGLLTGNLEKGAQIKLGACGIYHCFLDGAFGSDNEDRDMLLPIAIQKFSAKGFDFDLRECIIIGDTPRDVRCAQIHDAQCIAVATGPYSKEDLRHSGADMVLDSLEDKQLMSFLGLNTH